MNTLSSSRDVRGAAGPWLPVVLLLFVGSGCAALIYEIVWLQLLQLVIGSSAVSLGVLLGTFMGGMCLGSLLLPRVTPRRWHPLAVYAALELGIGVIGVLLLFVLPQLDELYAAAAIYGRASLLLRGLLAGACLLPPTLLMGATLPAVARWVEASPRGIAWLGFFYGGNIAGAVLGCLLAGFYLLRVYDMATATYAAAAINLAVAVISLLMARATPFSAPVDIAHQRPEAAAAPRSIYVAIGLSGLGALGAEVVWTRLLSLMIGGTVYTFSIILAVFLIGLGLGSSVGSFAGREVRSPRLALGVCQFLLAAAIAWTAYMLARSLPYWPIDPSLAKNPWHNLQLDFVRCLWAVLPAAFLWGASFPLALAAANRTHHAPRDESLAIDPENSAAIGAASSAVLTRSVRSTIGPSMDTGRLVGAIYAANTVGAIVGALLFSLFLVGWIGTQHSQQVIVLIAVTAALVTLIPMLLPDRGAPTAAGPLAGAALAAAVGAAAMLAWTLPPTPGELIAHGRRLPTRSNQFVMLYQGEGLNSSVAVTRVDGGFRNFHVSGKIEASSEPPDMRLQRMLGHIPALVHPEPKSVLVVGCGAGVTAGSFLVHPSVQRVVICEIEPLIPNVVAQYFADENYGVVRDKRVEIVYDDARHFILTTREKFDVITSDPINPWVKGAATLYTEEYFRHCKARLNEGGVITQWVPLYESNPEAVKSELATFFRVFPEGTVWGNDIDGQGYDVVLLGQQRPLVIDVDALQERLGRSDHWPVAESLYQVGFQSSLDLLATYAGSASNLSPWLADAQINRDRNLRLQYLAGLSAHDYREAAIFDQMLKYRQYPDRLFAASATSSGELRRRLGITAGQR
jgi:spermidine synthase